jgi:hypothetical protein
MKNLFNNLLLNSRFVFQNAGPEAHHEAEQKAPEMKEGPEASREKSADIAKERTDKVRAEGHEGTQKAKDNVIRLQEIHVLGKLDPKVKALYDKVNQKLADAPGPKAREIRVAKLEQQAKSDPDMQTALDAWKEIHSPAGKRLEQVAANTQATVESNEEHIARVEANGAYKEGLRILNALKSGDNADAAKNIEGALGTGAVDKMISNYNSKADGFKQAKNWDGLKELGKQVEFNAKRLGEVAVSNNNTPDNIRNSGRYLQKMLS